MCYKMYHFDDMTRSNKIFFFKYLLKAKKIAE